MNYYIDIYIREFKEIKIPGAELYIEDILEKYYGKFYTTFKTCGNYTLDDAIKIFDFIPAGKESEV